MFVFQSRRARLTVVLGVAILAVVLLPYVILNLGECTGSVRAGITCDHLPQAVGKFFYGLHRAIDFAGLITARAFFEGLGAALIIFGFVMEIAVRRRRSK